MLRPSRLLHKKKESGQGMVEFALLAAMLSFVIVGGSFLMFHSENVYYDNDGNRHENYKKQDVAPSWVVFHDRIVSVISAPVP